MSRLFAKKIILNTGGKCYTIHARCGWAQGMSRHVFALDRAALLKGERYMFSTIDKALVALLGAAVFFVSEYTGMTLDFVDQGVLQSAAAVLTPLLVWAIPNKA